MGIIYRLISPSGKSYIGLTKGDLDSRFKLHVHAWNRRLKKRKQENNPGIWDSKLHSAFIKYPPEQWAKEVIAETHDLTELDALEIKFIKEFDSIANGYNVKEGGRHGNWGEKRSEDNRKNSSEARKAYYETEEGIAWKKSLSEKWSNGGSPSYKGMNPTVPKHSEETKRKMSESHTGFEHTEKSKAKMSEIRKEQWNTDTYSKRISRQKKTYQVTHPDGKIEIVYGLADFCREHNLTAQNLGAGGTKGFECVKLSDQNLSLE